MINFKEVGPNNWRKVSSLKVSKNQEKFVASNVTILARAYAYRNDGANVSVILDEEEIIGLLLYREWSVPPECYILDQFMIGEKFQGRGYGKLAMEHILNKMREEGKYNRIELCYCQGNKVAENFYKNLGFYHTFDEDEGIKEINMALDL